MDSLMDFAKHGIQEYQKSHSTSDVSKTGGSEYNRPSHSQHEGRSDSPDVDEEYAVKHATQHGSGDESLFSSAMSFLKTSTASKDDIKEEDVVGAHKTAYKNGSPSSLSADSLGSAAALQAFQSFISGPSGGEKDSKTTLISMAMAEASKLFESSGGTTSGGKQDAVNSAATTVMKLLIKSKFSAATGGSNSGGLGSLFSMASKLA